MKKPPIIVIKNKLGTTIPASLLHCLPEKWEKIGDVLIVKLDKNLLKYKESIGKIYAEVLQIKTVLHDKGGIEGIYRKPCVEIVYGLPDTQTIHKENNVLYKLDPQQIMFSSGNMDERKRMATISKSDEVVVDLFAGIGYFSLPLAVYSRPLKIYACEINPVSYNFLCDNIVLNHVTELVSPLLGDNQQTAPKAIADRIIMGYLHETYYFLPLAFDCLKKQGGIIHYHTLSSKKNSVEDIFHSVNKIGVSHQQYLTLISNNAIKSYAPGINHIVLDIRVESK
ncbi:MAG: class I SAM-dependent methyltransferase family protein [Thermoplasmatota archaeon]